MANHDYAILLAGGKGSRFWPQSRALEPKQFLALHKDKTLFEQAIARVRSLTPAKNIYIATSELYRSQISELVKPFAVPSQNLVFEPDGKNTAPSIAVTVALIHGRDPEARIAVLPCDHLIKNNRKFLALLRTAFASCSENLVIFGIPPTRPATGYGYVQAEGPKDRKNVTSRKSPVARSALRVKRFTEKPDELTARKFLKSGDYYWNSGIFVGAASVFMREFRSCLPQLYTLIKAVGSCEDIPRVWKKIKPISFDYGVLERSPHVRMLAADGLGWSDLGSWQAWDEVLDKDAQGNIFKADVVSLNSTDTTIVGANRLIAAIGLDGLIVVDTPDALLITRKDKSEDVKKIVDMLAADKRTEQYAHKTVRRPWGCYTVLELGQGFKVKLVEVKPGCALSLQFHKKRSEHWVVVEGTAQIVKGKRSFIFKENESTYIPIGCCHRLCNPSKEKLLKIIEVQAGRYLEEDDIVRLKDDFGRIPLAKS